MKKKKLSVGVILLSGSLLFSSCIGSFGLWNNLKDWNSNLGDKYTNEIVFLALNVVPVYTVCYLADILVLNSIEFWTGDSPVASIGTVKEVKGEKGDYLVTTLKDGYTIAKKGETASIDLLFNKSTNTWSVKGDEVSAPLLTLNDNNTADLYLQDGSKLTITLDERGKLKAEQAMLDCAFAIK